MSEINQDDPAAASWNTSVKGRIRNAILPLLMCNPAGQRLVCLYRMQKNYLKDTGWFRSVKEGMAVDMDGRPLPWITYPAIHFLDGRVCKDMTVFEWGSGNSTRWWSVRVAHITSCEHDETWYSMMKKQLPENVDYRFQTLVRGGDYSKMILATNRRFDIAVIDGRDRINCAKNAVTALTEGGVLVWDNTDREEYAPGLAYLAGQGFRRLDFYGLAPIVVHTLCTSVFYRDKNILGI